MRLIQEHGWTDDVDLVNGGRVDLLLSDRELELVRRDREAATDAGWSLDDVLDLSTEEVEAVSVCNFNVVATEY